MEFGYLRLGEGFVQSSSIMPQKRNPVALEHARAIGSKAVGQAQAIMTTVHNTPFGDIVDTEDDLQPLVASMFRDATRTVTLVAATMRGADFDVDAAGVARGRRRHDAHRAGRHAGARSGPAVPDRARHCRAAAEGARPRIRTRRCRTRCAGVAGAARPRARIQRSASSQRIMSPRISSSVRRTLGGPAPEETARALAESRQLPRRRPSRPGRRRRDHLARRRAAAARARAGRYERRPQALRPRRRRRGS